MKHYAVVSLLVFWLSPSISIATPQTAASTQTATASVSQQPKWTEADRKTLLAKAQRRDRGSQMWLGAAYEQGWFGNTNFHEALKWFRKAAALGDPDAQNSLGQMYQDGEGVQQNCTEAAKWYRMAAEHVPDFGGAGQGRNNLGLLSLDGNGVPKDYVQAYMWFRLTRHQTNLPYAKAQMTPAQIVEAEQMATEWKRSHPER
jgi:TPR repeat protein